MNIDQIIQIFNKLRQKAVSPDLSDADLLSLVLNLFYDKNKSLLSSDCCSKEVISSLYPPTAEIADITEEDIRAVEKAIKDIQTELESCKKSLNKADSDIAESKRVIASLTTMHQEHIQKEENLTNQLAVKNQEISNKDAELANKSNLITQKDQSISNLQEIIKNKDSELNKKDKQIIDLQAQLSARPTDNIPAPKIEPLNDELKAENDKLKDQIENIRLALLEVEGFESEVDLNDYADDEIPDSFYSIFNSFNRDIKEIKSFKECIASYRSQYKKLYSYQVKTALMLAGFVKMYDALLAQNADVMRAMQGNTMSLSSAWTWFLNIQRILVSSYSKFNKQKDTWIEVLNWLLASASSGVVSWSEYVDHADVYLRDLKWNNVNIRNPQDYFFYKDREAEYEGSFVIRYSEWKDLLDKNKGFTIFWKRDIYSDFSEYNRWISRIRSYSGYAGKGELINDLKILPYARLAVDLRPPETILQCNEIATDPAQLEKEKNQALRERDECRIERDNLKDQIAAKDAQISEKDNQLRAKDESIAEKDSQINNLNTNLNNVRDELNAVTEESTQNHNLSVLYKAEADKFKEERDKCKIDLEKESQFWTFDPLNETEDTKKLDITNLGTNFANSFKNLTRLRYVINSVHTDYTNRVRSRSQTMANLGWFFNYLLDDILRVLDEKIGANEKTFLNKRKFADNKLRQLRQKRSTDPGYHKESDPQPPQK